MLCVVASLQDGSAASDDVNAKRLSDLLKTPSIAGGGVSAQAHAQAMLMSQLGYVRSPPAPVQSHAARWLTVAPAGLRHRLHRLPPPDPCRLLTRVTKACPAVAPPAPRPSCPNSLTPARTTRRR